MSKNSKIRTLDPANLSTTELHGHLLTAVAPRPICLASTIDKNGNVNLSPFSFFNVFSANPPMMIFSPARRTRDNTTKHSYENVLATKEVSINIVNYPMVEQVSLSSTEYEHGVNEFEKSGLTPIASEKISPPRVLESPVSFECKVDRVVELGKNPGAGNLIFAEVVLLHLAEEYLNKEDKLDTERLDLVSRMGGSWYCRCIPEALFEIPKPVTSKGVGVDNLPKSIRESNVLTGNNLGRLGNIKALPQKEDIHEIKNDKTIQQILNTQEKKSEKAQKLHLLAKEHLEKNHTDYAIKVLLLSDSLQ